MEREFLSSATLNDNSKANINDVWFKVNLDKTKEPNVVILDDIKNLPQVLAFGNLASLKVA